MDRSKYADATFREYFLTFCEEHGGDPFEYRGWLLFRDGWRYSNASYHGPELPPVSKREAKELSAIYWKLRRAAIVKEQRKLSVRLQNLEGVAEMHGLLGLPTPAGRKLDRLRDRMDDLDHWFAECEQRLAELDDENAQAIEADNGREAAVSPVQEPAPD